jgi:hypothetical protein
MAGQRLEDVREQMLVALTYLAYDHAAQSGDVDAMFNKDTLLQAYPKEQIDAGAMLVLSMLISVEARMMDKPFAERIEQVRETLLMGLQIEE